jgi:hypothetical protein
MSCLHKKGQAASLRAYCTWGRPTQGALEPTAAASAPMHRPVMLLHSPSKTHIDSAAQQYGWTDTVPV